MIIFHNIIFYWHIEAMYERCSLRLRSAHTYNNAVGYAIYAPEGDRIPYFNICRFIAILKRYAMRTLPLSILCTFQQPVAETADHKQLVAESAAKRMAAAVVNKSDAKVFGF